MSEKTAWDEAEEKTDRELGPYPHGNLAVSVGLGLAVWVVSDVVMRFASPADTGLACMVIGAIVGVGHYGWFALRRREHERHFAVNLKQIEALRALRDK